MNKLIKSCCLIIVGLIILLSSCSADNNTKQPEPSYSSTKTESSCSSAEIASTTVAEIETTSADNSSTEKASVKSIKEQISNISVEQAKDMAARKRYKNLNECEVFVVKTVLIKQGLDYILKNQTKYNQCESKVQISLMDVILDETPEILLSYYNKDNISCLDVISCVSKDRCSVEITIMGIPFTNINFLTYMDPIFNERTSYMVKTSYTVNKSTYTDWNCINIMAFYSGLICRKIVNDDGTVGWESYCKGEKAELSAEEIEYFLSDTSYGYAKSEKDNIIAEPFYTSDTILIQDINSEAFIDELIAGILNSTKKGS